MRSDKVRRAQKCRDRTTASGHDKPLLKCSINNKFDRYMVVVKNLIRVRVLVFEVLGIAVFSDIDFILFSYNNDIMAEHE